MTKLTRTLALSIVALACGTADRVTVPDVRVYIARNPLYQD